MVSTGGPGPNPPLILRDNYTQKVKTLKSKMRNINFYFTQTMKNIPGSGISRHPSFCEKVPGIVWNNHTPGRHAEPVV